MTCKDCIHHKVCSASSHVFLEWTLGGTTQLYNKVEEKCNTFEDSAFFVKLPVKIGDTVYEHEWDWNGSLFGTDGYVVQSTVNGIAVLTSNDMHSLNGLGSTFFVSKEEAEIALKEEESNEFFHRKIMDD